MTNNHNGPRNVIVIVVGVPGTGKTSILSALQDHDSSVNILNYGKAMLTMAGKAEIDRDQMRRLSPEEQAALGRSAAQHIVEQAKASEGTTTIVDTHALIQSPHGFVPGLPMPVLQVLKPNAICVIEAAPEFVLKCRQKDGNERSRENESIDGIRRHQELTRQFAVSCAAMTGCVLQFVENNGEAPAKIAESLSEMMSSLKQ